VGLVEEIRHSQNCYLSTPAHVRSFIGQLVYVYTDKGRLALTDTRLRFHGRKTKELEIPFESVGDLCIGHYSRLAKPMRLDYLAVTFQDGDGSNTLYFTPTHSWWTPVWDTNSIVAGWAKFVSEARSRNPGRTVSPSSPS
jgi:hypothetical protein